MITFFTKLYACILNGSVEEIHDRVGFDEEITSPGGVIPIVGMFPLRLIIEKLRKVNERLSVFPFVPLYWNHESQVHITQRIVHTIAKIGSNPNLRFSKTIRPKRLI